MVSKDGSIRPWSCSTLADGVDTLLDQSKAQEEQELHLQAAKWHYDEKGYLQGWKNEENKWVAEG